MTAILCLFSACSSGENGALNAEDKATETTSAVTAAEGTEMSENYISENYIVDTIAELEKIVPESGSATVTVKGYYTENDGGGGIFYWVKTAQADANGGTVIKPLEAETGRFFRICENNLLNVKWFGAVGDGSHDDYQAIQNAINALPDGGGTVSLPAGNYTISKSINIGDGDAAGRVSSKAGVKLVGEGGGFGNQLTPSTVIKASSDMDYLVKLNGRISDCEISRICFLGNGKSKAGLFLHSFTGALIQNITVSGFTETGIKILAGGAPTGNYNIFNRFESVCVFASYDNTTCLYLHGDAALSNDTWLTTFTGCRFDTAQTENSIAAHFKFVDSISFYRCHFNTYKESSIGAVFDALDNDTFPCGMGFYDCSVSSTKVLEDANHHIRINTFYGFGTYDNEKLPEHNRLIGITDTGVPFNMEALTSSTAEVGSSGLIAKRGMIDAFTYENQNQNHHNLAEGKTAAILVNAKDKLLGGTFYLSSYGNNTGTIVFKAYKWDTDYGKTVAGECLGETSVSNFEDNSWNEIFFGDGLDAGEYLIVISGVPTPDDYGVAVWSYGYCKDTNVKCFLNGQETEDGIWGTIYVK